MTEDLLEIKSGESHRPFERQNGVGKADSRHKSPASLILNDPAGN